MSKVSAAKFAKAWRTLNEKINSTAKLKLTSMEKSLLKLYLYNDSKIENSTIHDPFIRKVFNENETSESEDNEMQNDERFEIPSIFNERECSYIRNEYSSNNTALSRVALVRAHLKFNKISNVRIGHANGQWPLRHMIVGR